MGRAMAATSLRFSSFSRSILIDSCRKCSVSRARRLASLIADSVFLGAIDGHTFQGVSFEPTCSTDAAERRRWLRQTRSDPNPLSAAPLLAAPADRYPALWPAAVIPISHSFACGLFRPTFALKSFCRTWRICSRRWILVLAVFARVSIPAK